jgi:hypothetical protein
MLSTILTLALISQTPAPPTRGPLTPAQLKAVADGIRARSADPKNRAKIAKQKAEEKARRDEFWRQYQASAPQREAARRERLAQEAKAQAAAQKKAEDDYRKMLPFMLEAQRQQLERMSAMERNAALQRMAGAAEYQAQTDKQRADMLQWWLMQNRPK